MEATKLKSLEFNSSILLSKKFYYCLIAFFLSILLFVVWNEIYWYHNDFAIRFLPTLIGLTINFVFLIVFFDLREYLELKVNERPVKERIGRQIFELFKIMSDLTEVDIQRNKDGSGIYDETLLHKLATEEVKLNEVWKDKQISPFFVHSLENQHESLDLIAVRYERLLDSNPNIRDSILVLEDYLSILSFELSFVLADTAKSEQKIIMNVKKIIEEIYKMRKNRIDVGF